MNYDPFNCMGAITTLTSLIESGKRRREEAIANGLLDIVPLCETVNVVGFDNGLTEYARQLKVTADYHNLRLLTANQCGIPYRMMLVDGEIFVNPTVVDKSKQQGKFQVRCKTCGSALRNYHNWIVLSWQNLDGASQTKKIADTSCSIIQHGIRHLQGVTE